MVERIAKLIDVKSITTLAMLAVFCYMNVAGKDVSDGFNNIFTVIIAFYFGTQSQKNAASQTEATVITDEREVINNGD